jgi:hypothetical protein
MAKKAVEYPSLEQLAKEMYLLLIQCGMHLDGEQVADVDALRDEVAGTVREMDGYYMRKRRTTDVCNE